MLPTRQSDAQAQLRGMVRALSEIGAFSHAVGRPLREYQLEVARAVLRSVKDRDGLTFTVMFPRQAGKNELSAQIGAFLLTRRQAIGGQPGRLRTAVRAEDQARRQAPTANARPRAARRPRQLSQVH